MGNPEWVDHPVFVCPLVRRASSAWDSWVCVDLCEWHESGNQLPQGLVWRVRHAGAALYHPIEMQTVVELGLKFLHISAGYRVPSVRHCGRPYIRKVTKGLRSTLGRTDLRVSESECSSWPPKCPNFGMDSDGRFSPLETPFVLDIKEGYDHSD